MTHRVVFVGLALTIQAFGQTSSLRGVISDESDRFVPGTKVTLSCPGASARSVNANAAGVYAFSGLPVANCKIGAQAPGLTLAQPIEISIKPGSLTVNIQLKVSTRREEVTVNDTAAAALTPDPAANSSAIVLRGEDLNALSDDPTDLEADLQALAGPSAGPNGGAIYVDGFSGGQLPSKDSIREVRINQNPFAPEYDKLGFGRVEILTKPGFDKFRGSLFFNIGSDLWNSRNPYAAQKAPFLLREFGGNTGGPIGKKTSFFFDLRRDATDNGSIINAVILDPSTLLPQPFSGTYRNRQRAIRLSPRLDYQLTANNTATLRYAFTDMNIPGAGVGSFNLASRAFDAKTTSQMVQLADTQVLGSSAVNELRFQYFRSSVRNQVPTDGPALQVLGAFNSGAATVGNGSDTQNSYELQNYDTVTHRTHTLRLGVRLRKLVEDSISPQNFNGTFSFNGGAGISSIDLYRLTLLKLAGPTQFSIITGNPALNAGQFDFAGFFGDDWRARPNLTFSAGIRYERQTNIDDTRDYAPRIGLAWAVKPKIVLRAGFGMFYDRFALANTINADRYDGTRQQQFVVTNPTFFPDIPSISSLAAAQSPQIVQRISPLLRAPYVMQSAFGFERQLPWQSTLSLTYANSHGLHILRSRDINAPAANPIFEAESAGLYNQNQLIVNTTTRAGKNVSLNSSFMLNRALSNSDGINTFPANQYSTAGEYGPASTDIRRRFSLAGSVATRWNVRISPLVVLQSGLPFNITSGQDLYGTTLFNSRPGLATNASRAGVLATPYGLLDPNPTAGEAILGRNSGRGPGSVRINMRIAKTIGLGRRVESSAASTAQGSTMRNGPGGGVFSSGGGFAASSIQHRYNLVVSLQMENLLNHNNPGPIIGNLTSPLFGRANQPAGAGDLGGGGFSESANNRRLELQIRFNF